MLAMSRDLPVRKCTEVSCNGLCWNVEMLVVLGDTRLIESKVWTERDFEVVFEVDISKTNRILFRK